MPLAASSAMRLRSCHDSGMSRLCSKSNRFPLSQNSVTMHSGDTTTPMNRTATALTKQACIALSRMVGLGETK